MFLQTCAAVQDRGNVGGGELMELCLQGWCWVCGYGRGSLHSLSGKTGSLCPNCFFFFKPKIRLTLNIFFPFESLQFVAHAISPNENLGA